MDINLIVMSAFAIFGLKVSGDSGMVFCRAKCWLSDRLNAEESAIGKFIFAPIWGCAICMSSTWGSLLYLLFNPLDWWLIPHVFTVAGIIAVVSAFYYSFE